MLETGNVSAPGLLGQRISTRFVQGGQMPPGIVCPGPVRDSTAAAGAANESLAFSGRPGYVPGEPLRVFLVWWAKCQPTSWRQRSRMPRWRSLSGCNRWRSSLDVAGSGAYRWLSVSGSAAPHCVWPPANQRLHASSACEVQTHTHTHTHTHTPGTFVWCLFHPHMCGTLFVYVCVCVGVGGQPGPGPTTVPMPLR